MKAIRKESNNDIPISQNEIETNAQLSLQLEQKWLHFLPSSQQEPFVYSEFISRSYCKYIYQAIFMYYK